MRKRTKRAPRRSLELSPRWKKLHRIGQAHLAPGMSAQRLDDILKLYKVGRDWGKVSDETLSQIILEITEIVNKAKKEKSGNA